MADFDRAVQVVFEHEGGFADDPSDPGGPTSMGVSLAFLRAHGIDIDKDGDIDAEDVRHLTRAQAKEIYRTYFWEEIWGKEIESQVVATKLLDMAVHLGPGRAIMLFQRVLKVSRKGMMVDGKMGPITLNALNASNGQTIVNDVIEAQKKYYEKLVCQNASLGKFLTGWRQRARWGKATT